MEKLANFAPKLKAKTDTEAEITPINVKNKKELNKEIFKIFALNELMVIPKITDNGIKKLNFDQNHIFKVTGKLPTSQRVFPSEEKLGNVNLKAILVTKKTTRQI